MVAFQWSQSVQKIGIFSPCFLFLRIFRSTLLNNLYLHTLQDIDVYFLCEYSDSHCFTIYACTHCNNTYNMDLQWSHFNDLKVCKKLEYFPHVSYSCEYSDPHCLTIYACTHYKTSMYPFYVNIQIHIALQSILAHIAIKHTICSFFGSS